MPKMREVALEHKVHELNSVISGQADRIAELESLAVDMYYRVKAAEEVAEMDIMDARFVERMRELGIEVDA